MYRLLNIVMIAAAFGLTSPAPALAQTDAGAAMPPASASTGQGMPTSGANSQSMPAEGSGGQAAPAATPATTAAPSGSVAKAAVTTAVINRQPQSDLNNIPNSVNKVYYFTDLHGMKGETVTHRWIYQGKTMATVKLHVGANRWRTWSSKQMLPGWTGDWVCETVGPQGHVLNKTRFRYTRAGAAPSAPAQPAADTGQSGGNGPARGQSRSGSNGISNPQQGGSFMPTQEGKPGGPGASGSD